MDLVARGLNAAANAVFNRYLIETAHAEDLDALVALPLFLSLRAAIRAKVTAERLVRSQTGDADEIETLARRYFRLAVELIEPSAPAFVCIGGLSGTGKSMLARALAPELMPAPGAVVLRSDIERKRMFGLPEAKRLGAEAYTREVTARVYTQLVEKAGRVARAGHSVVVDAVFARPEERAAMAQAAHASNTACQGLFLSAGVDTRAARVGMRHADASDADESVVREQESYQLGELDWTIIDASGTPADTLALACDALRPALPRTPD
jgi:predicted kinase